MSFDEWMALWSGRVAVGATVLAAVAGMLLWFFGNRATAAKDDAFARFKAGAESKLAESNARSAEAAQGTATALANAAELKERAGKLELEAAQQRERAASAERQLLEVKTRIEPRRLSAAQRETILSAIRAFAGTSITVTKLGDAEAARFADDVIGVFTSAKWSLTLHLTGVSSPPPYGIMLMPGSAGRSPAIAAMLDAFAKAGFPVSMMWPRGPLNGVDTLLIGHRPVAR